MATSRRWSDLDERTRKLLITVAVADAALRVAALIDIKRRPNRKYETGITPAELTSATTATQARFSPRI